VAEGEEKEKEATGRKVCKARKGKGEATRAPVRTEVGGRREPGWMRG